MSDDRQLFAALEIAKNEAKERVYEEFNVIEEEVPDNLQKFMPLPQVEPHGVFEKVGKSLNPDAKPWCLDYRDVDKQSSGVAGAQGSQSMGIEMLEAINKMQLQVEEQIKTQKLPKSEIMSLDGTPLNCYLFMKTLENSVEKCTEDDSMRLQLLIQYFIGKAEERMVIRWLRNFWMNILEKSMWCQMLGLRSYLKGLLFT